VHVHLSGPLLTAVQKSPQRQAWTSTGMLTSLHLDCRKQLSHLSRNSNGPSPSRADSHWIDRCLPLSHEPEALQDLAGVTNPDQKAKSSRLNPPIQALVEPVRSGSIDDIPRSGYTQILPLGVALLTLYSPTSTPQSAHLPLMSSSLTVSIISVHYDHS
jgi:hypothetical protein